MFASSRRSRHSPIDIWPGFVDALAALLMVIIFVLMTFVVSQLYLTDALSGRDEALARMTKKMELLAQTLGEEKEKKDHYQLKATELDSLLKKLETQLSALKNQLIDSNEEGIQLQQTNKSLSEKIEELNHQLFQLNAALETSEDNLKERDQTLKTIKATLDSALQEKIDELKALKEELETLKETQSQLEIENKKTKEKNRLGHYRSEFFAKLQQAIGDRSDIRVVGDRFVLQSEVLFDKASAELGKEGKKKLEQLAKALKEISQQIPKDLNWILRVDGHTDRLPINNSQFPSNWELSSARAISVVKFLMEKGIESAHLVAAGFGEHQPLTEGGNEKELARNRRIEFKLDQR